MLRRAIPVAAIAFLVACLSLFLYSGVASGQTEPSTRFVQSGYQDEFVTSVQSPSALAFTPDGRMLVTSQPGELKVFQNDSLSTALNISGRTCSKSERGLLGVAVDPNFSGNRFIYLYYTARTPNRCVNRVSRFSLSNDNKASGERILINNIPSPDPGNHNGGDLHFGRDGFLYVSVGDGTRSNLARNKSILHGKVLRITRNGGIPSVNPYTGSNSRRCNVNGQTFPGRNCQEIFAYGLRNPFRMAFDPNYRSKTRFFINDVGQTKWEEVNFGYKNADYGWDVREGYCKRDSYTKCGDKPPGMLNPIYAYKHTTSCSSITGGVVLPNGAWPGATNSSYIFGDFVCGRLYKLTQTRNGFKPSTFAYNMGRGGPVSMKFRDEAMYYTTYTGGGAVHRISRTS